MTFKVRSATWSDLEGVCNLIHAVCKADGDESMSVTPEELTLEWNTPGFVLGNDAWVVTNPDGKVIGYEVFNNRFAHAVLQGDGYVHPDYTGFGIGSGLLTRLDTRARQEIPCTTPDLRVFIRNGMGIKEVNARSMHEQAGYKAVRFSSQMEITLHSLPEPESMPEGIELRPFDVETHNIILHHAHEEAFFDTWGHTPLPYTAWQSTISGHPDFNPGLWLVAWDGAQVAGYALCRPKQNIGWVSKLGVRKNWRKHGLGLALLKNAFRVLYQAGYKTIGLTVDTANQNGATRLYERARMQIASQYVLYEKEYRSGLDPEG